MSQCEHGERIFREGTSKEGKPWRAWFCPSKDRANQCKPEWVKSDNPVQNFKADLDSDLAKDKDDKITRTAIAKSLIESGAKFGPEALIQAGAWFSWCKTGTTPQDAVSSVSDPNEIPVSDIPF